MPYIEREQSKHGTGELMELRETLEAVKKYCEDKNDCRDCPAWGGVFKKSCGFNSIGDPFNWDTDKIVKAVEEIARK